MRLEGVGDEAGADAEPVAAESAADVDRLWAELVAAQAEIARLRAENERLRARQVDPTPVPVHRSPKLFAPAEDASVPVFTTSLPR